MKFNEKQLEKLRQNVKTRLSEKRFEHTEGVVRAALKIAGYFPAIDTSELVAAALLHDVTKELDAREHCNLANAFDSSFSDSDIESEAILHSLSAPYMVMRDFTEFATENILSALKNHTTAETEMSLFDEIIYIADYVEDGRTYPACIRVRELLYHGLETAKNDEERLFALHFATLESLKNTINSLLFRGRIINERTERAAEYFSALLGNGD